MVRGNSRRLTSVSQAAAYQAFLGKSLCVKVAGAGFVGGTEYSSDRDEDTAGSQLYAIWPCENFSRHRAIAFTLSGLTGMMLHHVPIYYNVKYIFCIYITNYQSDSVTP